MIPPGSVIGIIGGGQLGRMMAVAASGLGYKVHIYTPEEDSPASHVAYKTTVAEYDNQKALLSFAKAVDVITFEFENIPHESLALLEKTRPVCPSAHVLETCRHRVREKNFISKLGIPTTQFHAVDSVESLQHAIKIIGLPAVLKTSEMGYDGKGQIIIREENDAQTAWEHLHTGDAILEAFVDFEKEISVIVARNAQGQMRCFDAVENIHLHHILDRTIAPANISAALAECASHIARCIAEALNVCGLLAVEMFVTRTGDVLVNELAPRPHNSGHWTLDACVTSQFEQAIRAVSGLPLGSTKRLCDAQMQNLIGEQVQEWLTYYNDENARLHLYGKKDIRPGRKMGHVTFIKVAS